VTKTTGIVVVFVVVVVAHLTLRSYKPVFLSSFQ